MGISASGTQRHGNDDFPAAVVSKIAEIPPLACRIIYQFSEQVGGAVGGTDESAKD
jgi:hypothetical protein